MAQTTLTEMDGLKVFTFVEIVLHCGNRNNNVIYQITDSIQILLHLYLSCNKLLLIYLLCLLSLSVPLSVKQLSVSDDSPEFSTPMF